MSKILLILCLAFLVVRVGQVNAQDEPLPQYVAFVAYENDSGSEGTTVYWFDVQSGNIDTPFGLEEGIYCPLDWSPDGQWWAYAQQEEGNWSERLLNVATGEIFPFYEVVFYHSYFEWSPDSSQLVFTSTDDIGLERRYPFRTYLVRTDSDEIEEILSGTGRMQFIQWLSETQFLQVMVDENDQIHLYRVETSTLQIEEEIFTTDLDRPSAIRFSPDGTLLVVITTTRGHLESYFLNIQTGDVSPIWDTEDRNGVPVWSPDARWFAYSSYNSDRPDDEQSLFVFENTEGGETISASSTISGGYPSAIYGSPDSNHAVLGTTYRDDTNRDSINLDIVDLETGERHSVVTDLSILSGDIVWVSNTRFLFTGAPARLPPAPANDIYSYDLNTQEILNLTNSEANEVFECSAG